MTTLMSSPFMCGFNCANMLNRDNELPHQNDNTSPRVRKPYTISKQREKWTEQEHLRFLEALKLYGRAWRRIEEHIGSKTAVQIRSHAQKFFTKVEKGSSLTGSLKFEGSAKIDIPPPRPKRKPSHPYPRKANNGMESSTSFESKDSLKAASSYEEYATRTESWKKQKIIEEETGIASTKLRLFGQSFTITDTEESSDTPRSGMSAETEETSNTKNEAYSDSLPELCDESRESPHTGKKTDENDLSSGCSGSEVRQSTTENPGSSWTSPWKSFPTESNVSTFPTFIPAYWPGFMPQTFGHGKNDNVNAAALAAATFAVASAWQAIQGSIPMSSSDFNTIYSPVAVMAAARNSITAARNSTTNTKQEVQKKTKCNVDNDQPAKLQCNAEEAARTNENCIEDASTSCPSLSDDRATSQTRKHARCDAEFMSDRNSEAASQSSTYPDSTTSYECMEDASLQSEMQKRQRSEAAVSTVEFTNNNKNSNKKTEVSNVGLSRCEETLRSERHSSSSEACSMDVNNTNPSFETYSTNVNDTNSMECAGSGLLCENHESAETGEYLFKIKSGSALCSRYSGVGFVPYRRNQSTRNMEGTSEIVS